MLKLRIVQPGKEAVVHSIAGDQAVLGRASGCDVVVPESYVSKRHAKILAGLVVVDLGSSNGTHVDGKRIEEAILLTGNSFRLGSEATDALVEVEHEATGSGGPGDASAPALLRVREDLDAERRRSAALAAELETLRASGAKGPSNPAALPIVQELRRELQDALKRIESLKTEVAERDVSASEGVQVRLAQEALTAVQRQNDELRQQVAALGQQAAGPALEAAKRALAARVAELEADDAELRETLRRLQAELEASKAAAQSPSNLSELFFKLQAENRELRAKAEQAKAAPPGGASQLFFELQAANLELKKRLAEFEARPAAAAPAAAAAAPAAADGELAALKHENHTLRMSKADLLTELERMRARLEASAKGSPPVVLSTAGNDAAQTLLRAIVDEDVDARTPLFDDPLEYFVLLESFRFLRQVERLVTRMAGDFIQLYEQRTMLPDVSGNLRRLLGSALATPDEERPRRELVAYLDELRKWLVVALGANRRAAERFVEEVRSDLSERALTADKPIPSIKKLTGMADGELWLRASTYLKRLTADVVEERLQQLSRSCAEEIRREQDRG
ncbi:MAG: FHA domain-containing protein [Planctomycetes bacterium]|nr:FHA domain-containing protein [Planctomycetota bacterium]